MNIHEYQAKNLLARYGVKTPRGALALSAKDAREVACNLGGEKWVIKAQIHAGGRGKAGGVKLASSLPEVQSIAASLLGSRLITPQTGAKGKEVRQLYIEEGIGIKHEYYLALTLDRALEKPIMIVSARGGMDIEEVARLHPSDIIKVALDPTLGFRPFHARKLAFALGLPLDQQREFMELCTALYRLYHEQDAEIIELNPLVRTTSGSFLALDAKIAFDNNALYRHPDITALRDLGEEEPSEVEAGEHGLSYVKLEGNVGCMVNGAGLAMATMDIIKHEGGEPANFLDVGGGAKSEGIAKGFEIILKDPNVKAIFINIFGGIVRCDRVAQGILEAMKLTQLNLPLVVRLDGTNAPEAEAILAEAKIPHLHSVASLEEGARKAVQLAKQGGIA